MATPIVVTVEYLLDYVTSEHSDKPRYMQTVALSVQPYIDSENVALSYRTLFDLDTAVGEQLDMLGQWVGITRYIAEPIDLFFSLDHSDLGFDAGKWQTPHELSMRLVRLDDEHYRILLRARIVSNHWDGTIPGAYKAWDTLFAGTGYQVYIQDGLPRGERWFTFDDPIQGLSGFDMCPWFVEPELKRIYFNLDHSDPELGFDKGMLFGPSWAEYNQIANVHGNMTIIQALLGPPMDAVVQALFSGGYMGLDSAGVGTYHIIQNQGGGSDGGIGLPMFALDSGPEVKYWCTFDVESLGFDEAPIWYPGAMPLEDNLPHFVFDDVPQVSLQGPSGLDQGYWSTKEYPVEEPSDYLTLDYSDPARGFDSAGWYGAGAIPGSDGDTGPWYPPPADPSQPLPPTGIGYPPYGLAGFDLGAWAKLIDPIWRRGQLG